MIRSTRLVAALTLSVLLCSPALAGKKKKKNPKADATIESVETKAPVQDALAASLQAQWTFVPSAQDLRTQEIYKVALKVPAATEEELAALALTQQEQTMYGFIRMVVDSNPQDPQLDQFRALAENFTSAILAFDGQAMIATMGEMEAKGSYVIQKSEPDMLLLEATNPNGDVENLTVRFVDKDTITIQGANDTEPKTLKRVVTPPTPPTK